MDEKNNLQPQNGLHIPGRPSTQDLSAQRQAAINYRRNRVEQIYAGKTDFDTPQTSQVPTVQNNYSAPVAVNTTQSAAAQLPTSQQADSASHQVVIPQTLKQVSDTNVKIEKTPEVTTQNQAKGSNRIISPLSQNRTETAKSGGVDYRPQQRAENIRAAQQTTPNASQQQWQRYHAAWQNYYQKYYESYYTAALDKQKKVVANIQPEVLENLTEEQKHQRALAQLKQSISNKAKERTAKIRKSRHFVPIFSAALVIFTFLFLQYNRMIFAAVEAYVSPGNATSQETIQTPNSSVTVSGEPRLIIPKINVDVPISYGIGNDQHSQLKAMETGLAHFAIPGANSVPGQLGNTVLSGHSSNDLFDGGEYKFIFAQLEKMNEGDIFYANYQGTRYSYVVREKQVVLPTEVSKVIRGSDKAWMTLITCVPLGTAEKRLLVFAEQVSPDPSKAKPAESSDQGEKEVELPRNSKTFFERLFSWDWS